MKLDLLVVGLGGMSGSIVRYLVYLGLGTRDPSSFPWATWAVNISGCLLAGALSMIIERMAPEHRYLFLFCSVGFLGGFTTFSAFGLETFSLLKNQQSSIALLNMVTHVFIGLGAVWLGRLLATF